MRSHLVLALSAAAALLLLLLFGASRADAQFAPNTGPTYGVGQKGNISPYLGIVGNQNAGINYYLRTRSEQQRRFNAQQFRDELDDLETRDPFGAPDDGQGRQTLVQSGTLATFGSTMGYYNNRNNYIAPAVGRGGAGIGTQARPGRRR
jgi:hypothetical protein